MIGRLTGILAEKSPPQLLVDVNGVGYEVDVPMSTFYNLPGLGEKVTLLTHFVVREDAQVLFGFLTHDERATFRQLVKISGVGPRTALSILSGLSVAELAQAVSLQESGRLVKVPGIGKKTAERLLLELKGKLGDALVAPAAVASDAQADILQALVALGYSDREAAAPADPAHHRGDHRREEAADRDADQQAEGDLEGERALRAAREPEAEAENDRAGEHHRARADAVAERAPAEAGRAHGEEVERHRARYRGVRPAGGLRDRLQEYGEREHGADRDAGHERAERHHHPAVAGVSHWRYAASLSSEPVQPRLWPSRAASSKS